VDRKEEHRLGVVAIWPRRPGAKWHRGLSTDRKVVGCIARVEPTADGVAQPHQVEVVGVVVAPIPMLS
jgi:hypothetical protein